MNFINSFTQWSYSHSGILLGLGVSSIFIFVLSILGIGWFVAHIPEDYFLSSKRKPTKWQEQKLVAMPSIFRALNWIRIKAKKPPLKRNTI